MVKPGHANPDQPQHLTLIKQAVRQFFHKNKGCITNSLCIISGMLQPHLPRMPPEPSGLHLYKTGTSIDTILFQPLGNLISQMTDDGDCDSVIVFPADILRRSCFI